MNTDSNFSLANRKELADMLADKYESLRSKAKGRYFEKAKVLRQSIIQELAEKTVAPKINTQISTMRSKIIELRDELSQLGFENDSEHLILSGGSSNPLWDVVEKRIKDDLGSPDDIDARFDSAQLAMLTVASLEDADKLLKSVSTL
jgi:hypothetical protein